MPLMFRGTEKGETIYASASADIVYDNGRDLLDRKSVV